MLTPEVAARPSGCAARACGLAAAPACCSLLAGLFGAPAWAQDTDALRIVPTLDTSVTATDSSNPAAGGRGVDIVTQLRPGFQMSSRSGRLRGNLSYGLNSIHHSRDVTGNGQGNALQNSLSAALNAEFIERRVFLDMNANVSQQVLSPFGQQAVDGTQINSNRTEVARASVSPYAIGNLAGLVNYKFSLNADGQRAKNSPTPYSLNTGGNLNLSSASTAALFGWSIGLSQQRSRFSGLQATDDGRATFNLTVRPDPEVSGALRLGGERVAVGDFYSRNYSNWGGDLKWVPSPRTTASASLDQRYFGRSQQITFDHRLASSSIHYSSNRGSSDNGNANGVGQPTTLYQLFFDQFASIQPDPVLRDQLVRDFLRSLGQNPDAIVNGGYVNTGATLQRRDDLALSYAGRRTVFSLQGFSSNSRRLDVTGAGGIDTTPVRQYGLTASATYRLTPASNVNLSVSRLRTLSSATQAGNQLGSASMSWSNQLGRYISTSFFARYSVFDGPLNPYREASAGASLGFRF